NEGIDQARPKKKPALKISRGGLLNTYINNGTKHNQPMRKLISLTAINVSTPEKNTVPREL
ncbi:MAG TPA: hypothetical protein PLA68_11020, partial [Panacibacter sp.]|nr:hypothetical protein [Panacibacter sp.]